MHFRKTLPWLVLPACTLVFACSDEPAGLDTEQLSPAFAKPTGGAGPSGTTAQVALGKLLFEDVNLSVKGNQSCKTCHEPGQGFAAAAPGVTTQGSVVQGSVSGRFGDRKPPSAAYAAFAPIFAASGNSATGGNFWDGRATGSVLGNPAADQAMGPFLNPREQALPDKACVLRRVQIAYGTQYAAAFGTTLAIPFPSNTVTICSDDSYEQAGEYVELSSAQRAAVNEAYSKVALAIATYEGSSEVSPFSSKFDRAQLDATEQLGAKLFGGKGKCQQCHENRGGKPIFSDFKYHNLGVPRNPENPVYGTNGFDPGLGGFTGVASHVGKFRTPTVRNAAEGGANRTYMHNGSLTSLKQVVDFYNTRDVLPRCAADKTDPARWGSYGGDSCWPAPEFGQNLDTKNMGNLGLTDAEVNAIVAYITAMTDL